LVELVVVAIACIRGRKKRRRGGREGVVAEEKGKLKIDRRRSKERGRKGARERRRGRSTVGSFLR